MNLLSQYSFVILLSSLSKTVARFNIEILSASTLFVSNRVADIAGIILYFYIVNLKVNYRIVGVYVLYRNDINFVCSIVSH